MFSSMSNYSDSCLIRDYYRLHVELLALTAILDLLTPSAVPPSPFHAPYVGPLLLLFVLIDFNFLSNFVTPVFFGL